MMNILSYVLHTYLYLIYNKLLKQLLSCNLCHADNTLSDLGDASRHDHGNYKKSYCNFFSTVSLLANGYPFYTGC